jgi:hypothetical protein
LNWFDRNSAEGKFTLGGHESRTFCGDLMAFHDKRLMMPGQYPLRVRLVSLDIPSDTFFYTVDEPKGENRAIWLTMVQTPQDLATFLVPYFGDYPTARRRRRRRIPTAAATTMTRRKDSVSRVSPRTRIRAIDSPRSPRETRRPRSRV